MTVLLVADVGNTETTLGLWDGARLAQRWRILTDAARPVDAWAAELTARFDAATLAPAVVQGSAIGSVVPRVTPVLAQAVQATCGVAPLVVDARSGLPIRVAVDEPFAVGVDRLLNTFAVHRLHACDAIVIDLGTATTYDCITADGVFLGGVIAPGVRTAAASLVARTAQLAATALEPPPTVIGTNTAACIRAGVVYGAVESLEGLVRRIRAEWPTGRVPRVVATGGLATTLAPLCPSVEVVDPDLTLTALRLAYEVLAG